ncbi:hypothetical protein Ahy_A04g019308 [Arachis hypogaea]|uniref:Protein FAR1-RELATED SEQUENCE n=1 Tax=Arachis hypogaea TaxID=3818 RepID=A0A445DFQ6_ARAHY|nr:hypothetical protein Ahy_A04g019308 [Arachis hypogaea]
MSHVILNSYRKDAFDRNWNDLLIKYGLGGNKCSQVTEVSIRIIFMPIPFFFKTCTEFGSPHLIGSVYFAELYEDRHIWIPVYLDHHFWVGMRSTQRTSESIHAFSTSSSHAIAPSDNS